MPSDPSLLLDVRDLRVSFRSERGLVRAVDGVSFSVGRQEIVGLVGESGSGKTQTLLSLMGLIDDPNAIVEGEVRFLGEDLLRLPRKALQALRGGKIAMIFQDPMTSLTPVHRVGDQIVEQILAHKGGSRRAARDKALALLEAVRIANPTAVVARYPHELSGGMRQRVLIAMALSCDPALLLADEPTTALDVTVQAQILDLIGRLRGDFASSVILVTHDLGVVAEVADRVLVMYGGRVVEEGLMDEVFRDPLHPYTWGLFDSIPPLEGPRPRRLRSIPGNPPTLSSLPPGCAFGPRCRCRFDACSISPPVQRLGNRRFACYLSASQRATLRNAPNAGAAAVEGLS
ncbi:ABC transporter ATP-binding protein [Rhodospirillum rubrum]|uniref:Oligopeptide/dipeptide ABC transporter, ATP-binding protein-like n=1 Tax=Rhodospirillum rubrum (strain ATCC 11170 / ATH 1.1.1 / DSM 467 / LMG 4362 / NCIMB 8255 / S1) TaxID=269796 RepID=Q2RSC0_RHORT|nr:ABC transporter ATP-binding protein [Rhodospirillum rubrum]ABC22975.1 Oligopeptide/dipeptide ABC transporter, ATP-binding protein-like [Rhodospirillum rubrum ATCC 11170]AEO48705.1 oligopeptide/dipeptide ABC transporter ATP-binding protein-like protein [Rhodospirillum rubrum F11]MBK5954600.1 ABC transporter ATP-binding protein [Rhodospirillum rubrum]QXG78961.1 ABC transporter ATP-binding protein [Rhodospirillum rubrum]HAP98753.1 ABC transporter ATP-binding protein [Rhodospirillum rubrum]